MHVPRLRALLSGALVVSSLVIPLAAGAAGPNITLRELVEQAWQRSAAGRSQPARQLEADATRALSSSWLAGQPLLGLSQRSDRFQADRGLSESELSLGASLYTPGQRDARRRLADESSRELQALTRKSRLEIAGEVRSRLWDAASAQARLEEQQGHLHHTEALHEEIRRRVAAGELARVDQLLAEQELQAARVAVEEARFDAHKSAARLQVLTGHAGALPLEPEPLAGAAIDSPSLLAARAAEQRAQATLDAARSSRRAPPTVTLSLRRERDLALGEPERSLGLALQIPLGGAGRNRPLEAQAQAQLAAAGADAEQAEAAAAADLAVARAGLQHARQALDAARARVAALDEHQRLIERAFKLGERGLAELLRAHTLAHEAAVARRQQEVALARAHAQFNQASGVLP